MIKLTAAPGPSDLSLAETRLLLAYRKIDDVTRSDILAFVESSAVHRSRRTAGAVRLVSVGGNAVDGSPS